VCSGCGREGGWYVGHGCVLCEEGGEVEVLCGEEGVVSVGVGLIGSR
jgi:hypothetical protein